MAALGHAEMYIHFQLQSENDFRIGRALPLPEYIARFNVPITPYTFTKSSKMADGRMATWIHDDNLKEAMSRYVQQGLQRSEILDLLRRDFPQYPWSIQSLDRRLRHFEIYYNSNSVGIDYVTQAVENELKGPCQLLGYRAMHKVRQEYELNVTRDKVYDVMYELDPERLEARGGVGAKKERKKGNFTTRGANWIHSLDGHDKLMGYQNSTFPLAIYGCMDTRAGSCFG